MLESVLAVGGDERFHDLRYVIGDWTDCTESGVSVKDVEKLAAYVSAMARSNPHITNVSVMHSDFNPQAMINLYFYLTSETPWTMVAVRSLDEARRHLKAVLLSDKYA